MGAVDLEHMGVVEAANEEKDIINNMDTGQTVDDLLTADDKRKS